MPQRAGHVALSRNTLTISATQSLALWWPMMAISLTWIAGPRNKGNVWLNTSRLGNWRISIRSVTISTSARWSLCNSSTRNKSRTKVPWYTHRPRTSHRWITRGTRVTLIFQTPTLNQWFENAAALLSRGDTSGSPSMSRDRKWAAF